MKTISKGHIWLPFLFLFSVFPDASFAEEGICARVKIEIRQEMTLERQAFDAYMRINNGLDTITLENVDVDVMFADEDGNSVIATSDPNDPLAVFFIRIESMENISDVAGGGVVAPATSADIHWLIIPAPGASNGLEMGALYYIGATLTYTINGEEHVTEVSPDYIFVKPMPELVLDYFLPTDVYGDDAFTSEIEPTIPFALGVRVSNNGSGMAKDLKIDSAQPQIIDNEQGLLIGFNIEGSQVNGQEATPSLLAELGDIEPNRASVAIWWMTCSLSGEFTEFTADFSHADELGGELTSLVDAVYTHTLVRDVLVDLPGRDEVQDFLATFGQGYKVYESDNLDTVVTDQTASAALVSAGDYHTLTAPAAAGFMLVRLSDPYNGAKALKEVIRSDGKLIKPENAWLFKTRDSNNDWIYFFYLFDADTTESYKVYFEDPASGPQPPVLQFIPDRSVAEGQQLGFLAEASDPNGTIPALSATPLPAGAAFTDEGDGTARFYWIPASGQTGEYTLTFTASDEGGLSATRTCTITVTASPAIENDSDNDGMDDDWETKYFGALHRDGSGDFDGDGITDLEEFRLGTHPQIKAGDLNLEGVVDLEDAILGLQIFMP
jgi:hypothetical protein